MAFVVAQVSVADPPAVIVVGEADSVAVGATTAGCTVTVVAEVTVLPPPVAVSVYWVVADGLTVIDPEAATAPMPLFMETVVAFVVVQVSVAELPAVIVVGEADSVAVGAATACTVTVAAEVAVPPLPVAVNIYCVVADGLTVVDPDAATVPTPLLMETAVAFVVAQLKVTELPGATLAGVAEKEAVGPATGSGVAVLAVLLPQPERNPI